MRRSSALAAALVVLIAACIPAALASQQYSWEGVLGECSNWSAPSYDFQSPRMPLHGKSRVVIHLTFERLDPNCPNTPYIYYSAGVWFIPENSDEYARAAVAWGDLYLANESAVETLEFETREFHNETDILIKVLYAPIRYRVDVQIHPLEQPSSGTQPLATSQTSGDALTTIALISTFLAIVVAAAALKAKSRVQTIPRERRRTLRRIK